MVSVKTVLEDASPFVIGGISIGALTLLTKYVSTKWGVLAWIAPISLIISSIILYYFGGKTRAENKNTVRTLIWQSIPGMVLLVLILLAWALALDRLDFWPAFGIMMAAYVVAAVIFFLVFCPSPIPGGKCWDIARMDPATTVTPTVGPREAFAHREGIVFRDRKLVKEERRLFNAERENKLEAIEEEAAKKREEISEKELQKDIEKLQEALDSRPDLEE